MLLRGRKLNIPFAFISKSYFKGLKNIRSYTTHYFNMKIPNKREIQQIVSNHLSAIELKDFMKLYRDYIKEKFLFLLSDTTLPQDNPLRFRKNLLFND